MLRIKELQNQLTDAHYHLNELANENRLLKTLQRRQDSALKQYEGTSAELPRIINSHHEELRIIQSKYKKLKAQLKSTCEILRDKENELYSLQTQNKHLLQLSKDRHLGEREKLQLQVSDLNYRIGQQDETINTLNRKLTIETKYLKHQLHLEAMKHKESQKQLQEAIEKLKNVDDLLDNKERRLLYNNQLNLINKGQNTASQSLTNLGNNSITFNFPKLSRKLEAVQIEDQDKTLSNFINDELKEERIETRSLHLENHQPLYVPKTETMSSLLHVRNFRLQKPSHDRVISFGNRMNDLPQMQSKEENISHHISNAAKLNDIGENPRRYNQYHSEDESEIKNRTEEDDKEKIFFTQFEEVEDRTVQSGNISEYEENLFLQKIDTTVLANESRELHARLTANSEDDFDIVKLFLNLESTTDSLAIEDIDKSISEQLRSAENSDESYLVGTFAKTSNCATDPIGSDLKLKHNPVMNVHPSKIPLYNMKLNNSLRNENLLKLESSENVQSSMEINEHDIDQHELITTKLSHDFVIDSFKEQEILNQTNALKSTNNVGARDRDTKLQGSMCILSESSNILENLESTSSQKRKLSIKHSISEESEHATLETSDAEIKDDSPDALRNSNMSQDLINHTQERNSQIEDESIESSVSGMKINYNKERLLAAMKAIDDNENIEFLDHGPRKNSVTNRSQITENLFRGLPSHSRKNKIIRDLFEDGKLDKSRGGCKKMH